MSAPTTSRILLLVPTELEARELCTFDDSVASIAHVELCGFGPVAAAARTATLIVRHNPAHVILVGIAGTYDANRLGIGEAACFDRVALFGVGAGTGSEFVTPAAMGFPQWPAQQGQSDEAVFDEMELANTDMRGGMLLTCCAASATPVEVPDKLRLFPSAIAEDMEGFGVAMACKMAGVPVSIIRGISNTAGDRHTNAWKIGDALRAASRLAIQVINQFNESEPTA